MKRKWLKHRLVSTDHLMTNLVFGVTGFEESHHRGYLFSADPEEGGTLPLRKWRFERILACLNTLGIESGQNIFEAGDDEKCTFELAGTYNFVRFYLYDWKGFPCINICGSDRLDVEGLMLELVKVIKATEPTPFTATTPCGQTYTYASRNRR